MSRARIAIVGMACRFPDARTPAELWESVLAERRAFRRLPPERLRLEDYFSSDRTAPDRLYSDQAAVLTDWQLDRVRFRIPAATFRAADPAHWLALEVAAAALADAGFGDGAGLPRESTGVIVGNTLTGDRTRAHTLRLRWPYVRRTLAAALAEAGVAAADIARLGAAVEARFKAPFPPVGDETLAGGLANTIAGRICNHFDLHGGGFTVDGACSSSLLAVAEAARALATGELEVALAGGVDLSLDPFELVGFAKVGALAPSDMRVFDARSNGFWPGEGCGFVVLMREDEARASGRRVLATIAGWGISSDGAGGTTRPEEAGQRRAIERAWRAAGGGLDEVPLFEGHGTGTEVGDAVELRALGAARQAARAARRANGVGGDGNGVDGVDGDGDGGGGDGNDVGNHVGGDAAIGSIKANIGHTKAAAGVAGLIKATLALARGVVPPTTGCTTPHPELGPAGLRVVRAPEPWPKGRPRRAGVSAMGFGGINVHLALEAESGEATAPSSGQPQDAELVLLAAPDRPALAARLAELATAAAWMSRAELTDLAVASARALAAAGAAPARAALVARTPAELGARIGTVQAWLRDGRAGGLDAAGAFLGDGASAPRLTWLIPGQGVPLPRDGGAVARRFPELPSVAPLGEALAAAEASTRAGADEPVSTALAQPALVAAALLGLDALEALGVRGAQAIGHSLGELVALGWAGALDRAALLALARARGRALAATAPGLMLSLGVDAATARALGQDSEVVVAAFNAPAQTVLAGDVAAVRALAARARARHIAAVALPVRHAFHSPVMALAAPALTAAATAVAWRPLARPLWSTVTGGRLEGAVDAVTLLRDQLTRPVRFVEAVRAAAEVTDLFVEVGPGSALTTLARAIAPAVPALALDLASGSLHGLLAAVGAAFASGAAVDAAALVAGRFARPFTPARPRFLASPCEEAPIDDGAAAGAPAVYAPAAGAPLPASGISLPETGISLSEPRMSLSESRTSPSEPTPAPSSPPGVAPSSRSAWSPASPTAALPDDDAASALARVRALVAAHTELPLDAVTADTRLLDDLHLNSITVAQLAVEAARRLGLAPPATPSTLARATVGELAAAVSAGADRAAAAAARAPAGVEPWVRAFTVEWTAEPLRAQRRPGGRGQWQVVAPPAHPLAAPLGVALTAWGEGGVVVCLPDGADALALPPLLVQAARAARDREPGYLVLVQPGGGAAAWARTFHLEARVWTTVVVDVPAEPRAVDWIVREVAAASGFVEARWRVAAALDLAGGAAKARGGEREPERRVPRWRPLPQRRALAGLPLDERDTLLVTGGAQGIAALAGAALARASGAALLVVGRTRAADAPALAATLEALNANGLRVRYEAADVADAAALARALAAGEAALGPVTALLHGAGVNRPRLLADLDEADFTAALAPKLIGLGNLLGALDPARLRLVVTFGSIIGRAGLPGEAHYAFANEQLTRATEAFAAAHPGCRTLAAEWSVWSGLGMGERLGSVAALAHEGVSAIAPEHGVALLRDLLSRPPSAPAVIISGRHGLPPTVAHADARLPLLRFLEEPRLHYPGVELIADSRLSLASDPYLADHELGGAPLLPAVLGLEAMAQATLALTGAPPTALEQVELVRPLVLPPDGTLTLRLAALRDDDDSVRVTLRAVDGSFEADCFRGRCRIGGVVSHGDNGHGMVSHGDNHHGMVSPDERADEPPLLPLDVAGTLYGDLLFQRGRFARLAAYTRLSAFGCHAAVRAGDDAAWFGAQLPPTLVLGDPGRRDATLHAIQACVPDATLLPVAVDRLRLGRVPNGPWRVRARERERRGDLFVYDVDVHDGDGALVERWEGLRLRVVAGGARRRRWPAGLLPPLMERRARDLAHATLAVALEHEPALERRARSDRAFARVLGRPARVARDGDGRPTVEGTAISAAHAGALTLAVAGAAPLGCDLEPVAPRPTALWRDLLGGARHALALRLADELREDEHTASTRVWTVHEALRKAGAPDDAPIMLVRTPSDGWITLLAGPLTALSWVTELREAEAPLALALVVGRVSSPS